MTLLITQYVYVCNGVSWVTMGQEDILEIKYTAEGHKQHPLTQEWSQLHHVSLESQLREDGYYYMQCLPGFYNYYCFLKPRS